MSVYNGIIIATKDFVMERKSVRIFVFCNMQM